MQRVVELPPRARDDLGGLGQVASSRGGRSAGDRDRLLDEPLRLDDPVDKAELERLLRAEHLVLPHGVEDGELHRRFRAREPRSELGRPPGGDEAEQALRRCEMADVGGNHAVVAVQRELDTAAEHGPVDCSNRRIRERQDAPKEVVSPAAALDRLLAALDERKLVQVGAAGEAPRLPRDHERGKIALPRARGGALPATRAQRGRTRSVARDRCRRPSSRGPRIRRAPA